ncbi:MAG TPA: MBL fold metallo-hydrolase [Gaiellaceae bacterium]|nr:MBL fold metallo-hydrolase [Gaiellaceae bacterium]
MLPDNVRHWTAQHPEWDGPEVSSYAVDDGERLLLIDPLAIPDDLDTAKRDVIVLLTCAWHERDAREAVARFGAKVYAPPPDRPAEQLIPAEIYRPGDRLPFGVEAFEGREGDLDLVLWIEACNGVAAGDTLVAFAAGLEIPEKWLPDGVTVASVAEKLQPLLDKPVEVVLPTHGNPCDRAAFERAITLSDHS